MVRCHQSPVESWYYVSTFTASLFPVVYIAACNLTLEYTQHFTLEFERIKATKSMWSFARAPYFATVQLKLNYTIWVILYWGWNSQCLRYEITLLHSRSTGLNSTHFQRAVPVSFVYWLFMQSITLPCCRSREVDRIHSFPSYSAQNRCWRTVVGMTSPRLFSNHSHEKRYFGEKIWPKIALCI